MNMKKTFAPIYNFPGYYVKDIDLSSEYAIVHLAKDQRYTDRCPYCDKKVVFNRDVTQTVKDMPIGPVTLVLISYSAKQCYCSRCKKYHTFHPVGIDTKAKATTRFMEFVSRLCRYLPANIIPEFYPISASTARRWDKRILTNSLPEPNMDNLEVLLIDEKQIRKGHNYVTLILNGITGELLYFAEGKKKESIEPFFAKLTQEQKDSIIAVGIDRSGAYKSAVEDYLDNADIVFDRFHLIMNYNKVIDKVRRKEYLDAKKEDKDVIKGQRFNLFRNKENRTDDQKKSFQRLRMINENLCTMEIMKDGFRKLWTYVYGKCAKKHLVNWVNMAMESGIEDLQKFAKGVLRDQKEILAYCKHRVTSGKLEGFNNIVSRIVHRACGCKDLDYLFLKLRQASLANT